MPVTYRGSKKSTQKHKKMSMYPYRCSEKDCNFYDCKKCTNTKINKRNNGLCIGGMMDCVLWEM